MVPSTSTDVIKQTTPITLPPELLLPILDLASKAVQRYANDFRKRSEFLLRASLVSQSFQTDAQTLLWRKMRIESEARALAVLESPAFACAQTHSLMVEGVTGTTSGVSVQVLYELLRKLKVNGLRELELARFGETAQLSFGFLTVTDFSNLTTLTLRSVSIFDDPSLAPTSLNLHTLRLVNYISYSNAGYFPFPIPSLTSLTIQLSAPLAHHHSHTQRSAFLTSVAHQITYLNVDRMVSSSIDSTWALFSSLEHLETGFYAHRVEAILSLITSNLRSLTLRPDKFAVLIPNLAIALDLKCLTKLEFIKIPGGRDAVQAFAGGRELVTALGFKGVRLV